MQVDSSSALAIWRAVIKEFLVHYHQERPHQGLEQRCPEPLVLAPSGCLSAVRSSATIAWEVYCTSTAWPHDQVDADAFTPHVEAAETHDFLTGHRLYRAGNAQLN